MLLLLFSLVVSSFALASRSPATACTVLVPGIGGSQLYFRAANTTSSGTRAWVILTGAEGAFVEHLVMFQNGTGVRHPEEEVFTPMGSSGLDAIEYLVPTVWLGSYFSKMVAYLERAGFVRGRTLFGAPYDWRLGLEASATRLAERIKEVLRLCGGQRVSLVTHSMGGLVARLMLSRGGPAAELVERWIAVGAPHAGAGGRILNAFIQGYAMGNPVVSDQAARAFILEAPSAYDLWPPPRAPLGDLSIDVGPASLGLVQVPELLERMYRNHTISRGAGLPALPRPFRPDMLAAARATWRTMDALTQLPSTVTRFANIYGSRVPTPYNLSFPETASPEALIGHSPVFSFVSGDGTVPLASATSPGFAAAGSAAYSLEVPFAEHQALVSDPTVLAAVTDLLGAHCEWSYDMNVEPVTETDPKAQKAVWRFTRAGQKVTAEPLERSSNTNPYLEAELAPPDLVGTALGGKVVLRASEDCMRFTGSWTNSHGNVSREWTGQRVSSKFECEPASAQPRPCDLPYGSGVIECLKSGTWSQTCRATACFPGYYASPATGACVPCPRGFYKAAPDASPCLACSNMPKGSQGEYTDLAAATPACNYALFGSWSLFQDDLRARQCGWFWKFVWGGAFGAALTWFFFVAKDAKVHIPKKWMTSLLRPGRGEFSAQARYSSVATEEEEEGEGEEREDLGLENRL